MNIASLGSILGIWAHPDDETWACAGIMAEAIKNGQKVACVTATKGGAGKTASQRKWPQEQLTQIRETELGNALSIIGVHDLHWLGYEDGKLAAADRKRAIVKVAKLIDTIRPDTILTFERQGITGHADHRTICSWTCAAVKQSLCKPVVYGACETTQRYDKIGRRCDQLFDIYIDLKEPFMVDEEHGDLVFKLSRADAKQKLAALKAHQSQTALFFKIPLGKKYLKQLCDVECFVKLS